MGDTVQRLLPAVDDRDTAGFWEAARRHELVVRACTSCGAVLHMPRAYCHHCGSWDTAWRPVVGAGTLHSWTVVAHQVHPSFPVPFTVVLVDVDDAPGARMAGYLPGEPELVEGQAMTVWFEDVGDDVVLPQWMPAPTGGEGTT